MLIAPLSPKELRASLEVLLASPVPGYSIPTETGLDDATMSAVQAVWDSEQPAPAALVAAARAELERQIDGTHAAATRSRIAALRADIAAP